MSYRNKTYVAFASEDIHNYRLMTAWRANKNIEFDFTNAHDIYEARDTSTPETIKRRLRERLNNTKQVVLLGSPAARRKGATAPRFSPTRSERSSPLAFLLSSPISTEPVAARAAPTFLPPSLTRTTSRCPCRSGRRSSSTHWTTTFLTSIAQTRPAHTITTSPCMRAWG